jgi:hypothetical protein
MPTPGPARMFYGNYEFEPIPLFSWSTELVQDNKQEHLFLRNTLTFTGTLLENKASESGNFTLMMQKRETLKDSLTASGRQEWRITYNNNPVVSGIYPDISDLTFQEGVWVDRINYDFTLTYNEEIEGQSPVQSFSESWAFDENEDRRSVTARHEISAVGVNTDPSGTNNALENARTFVLSRTGYSNVPAGHPAFAEGSGTLTAYEELRTENVDVQAGSFAVNENFTLSSGNFVHIRTGSYSLDDQGISTVSIDGNIRGLGRGDKAFNRALIAWNSYIKDNLPGVASGIYLSSGGGSTLYTTNPQSLSLTRNTFVGTLDYSISYTDDASENLPSGVQDFTLSIQESSKTFKLVPKELLLLMVAQLANKASLLMIWLLTQKTELI